MSTRHPGRHRSAPVTTGAQMNSSTRTIAIIALVLVLVVLAILLF